METNSTVHDHNNAEKSVPIEDGAGEKPPAWELVEKGRYRPRRIKGSLPGRELG
jgi:hypothetical protein